MRQGSRYSKETRSQGFRTHGNADIDIPTDNCALSTIQYSIVQYTKKEIPDDEHVRSIKAIYLTHTALMPSINCHLKLKSQRCFIKTCALEFERGFRLMLKCKKFQIMQPRQGPNAFLLTSAPARF